MGFSNLGLTMTRKSFNKDIYKGYKSFYGQPIGILMMDSIIPRPLGDIGNAYTFDFPVRYKVVKGSLTDRIILNPDYTLLDAFIEAAQELEEEGVRAITTSCGYLVLFQKEIANSVNVPVFTSSLLQAPMVKKMLREEQKIGILVADSRTITDTHFQSAGIDFPVVVQGSENYPAFYDVFPTDTTLELNYDLCCQQVIQMVNDMLNNHPEVGAIVCEGSNFAIFRSAVQEATGIPFFDIVTLTRMVYQCVIPIGMSKGYM